jgi:hypothetical protein
MEYLAIYRAVGAFEKADIEIRRYLRAAPGAYEGKQFGLDPKETFKFLKAMNSRAGSGYDYVAIFKFYIPKWVFAELKGRDHSHVDAMIFKSGTLTVGLDDLSFMNSYISKIERVWLD